MRAATNQESRIPNKTELQNRIQYILRHEHDIHVRMCSTFFCQKQCHSYLVYSTTMYTLLRPKLPEYMFRSISCNQFPNK
jgi:hypothetical protein